MQDLRYPISTSLEFTKIKRGRNIQRFSGLDVAWRVKENQGYLIWIVHLVRSLHGTRNVQKERSNNEVSMSQTLLKNGVVYNATANNRINRYNQSLSILDITNTFILLMQFLILNYTLFYKKWEKFQNKFEFWKVQMLIINQSTLGYRVISFQKDLQYIMCFSLMFYAEKL